MIKSINTLFISILLILCIAPMLYAENVPGLKVTYAQKEDLLTVDANGVPLTQILAQISEQSGIEILVDPSVEKDINIYLPAQPLEKALKQLARDLNYAMHYNDKDSRLVAMKIVPQGKQSSGNLVSVTKPTARMGRYDGSGDRNYETSGGRDNRKSKQPIVIKKETLSVEEMIDHGIDVSPSKRKNSLPIQQGSSKAKEIHSDIDNTNGGAASMQPTDQ
jgi:type II secretory pathway component GspD/PulD (secretin)